MINPTRIIFVSMDHPTRMHTCTRNCHSLIPTWSKNPTTISSCGSPTRRGALIVALAWRGILPKHIMMPVVIGSSCSGAGNDGTFWHIRSSAPTWPCIPSGIPRRAIPQWIGVKLVQHPQPMAQRHNDWRTPKSPRSCCKAPMPSFCHKIGFTLSYPSIAIINAMPGRDKRPRTINLSKTAVFQRAS